MARTARIDTQALAAAASTLNEPLPMPALPDPSGHLMTLRDYHKLVAWPLRHQHPQGHAPGIGMLLSFLRQGLLDGQIIAAEKPAYGVARARTPLYFVLDSAENRQKILHLRYSESTAGRARRLLPEGTDWERRKLRYFQKIDALVDELLQPFLRRDLLIEEFISTLVRPTTRHTHQLNLSGLLDIGPYIDKGTITPSQGRFLLETAKKALRVHISNVTTLDGWVVRLVRKGFRDGLLINPRPTIYLGQHHLYLRPLHGPYFALRPLVNRKKSLPETSGSD